MPRNYKLSWIIDDAQARGVFKRGNSEMEALERRALKTLTSIEAANAAAGKVGVTAAQTAQAALTQAATRGAAMRKKIATEEQVHIDFGLHKLQVNGIKLQERLTGMVKTEADKRKQMLDAEARYQASQALGPAGRLAQVRRQALTEEQLQLAARNRAYDAAHQKRIRQILAEQYATKSAFEDAIANALGLGGALDKVGLAAIAAGAVVKGTASLMSAYDQIADDIERAAEGLSQMRENLRPEAILKGASRADNKTLAESLRFRAATGLNEAEASDLTRQFLGSLPAGIQKGNITQDVADRLMTQVGIMQARQGGAASTRGDLAGLLAQFGPIKSVEAGLGQMEAIRLALTAGRGDDTPLTNQLLKTAGSMVREGGPVGTLAEQAALIGVTSLSAGPEEAGTRAEQVNRALRSGLTKQGKAKGAAMPQADYLKSIGISEKDGLESAIVKLSQDVTQSGRDPEVYLAERGFRSYEERRALSEMIPNVGILQERLKMARQAQDGAAALQANRAFLESEAGQAAVSRQLGAVKTATVGITGERLAAMKQAAEASPEIVAGDQSIATGFGDFMTGMMMGHFTSPSKAGRERRVTGVAFDALTKKAQSAGVGDDQIKMARRKAYEAGPGYEFAFVNQMQGLIAQQGGSNAVDIEPAMRQLTAALEANTRAMQGQQGPKNAPPMLPVGPPPGGPAR